MDAASNVSVGGSVEDGDLPRGDRVRLRVEAMLSPDEFERARQLLKIEEARSQFGELLRSIVGRDVDVRIDVVRAPAGGRAPRRRRGGGGAAQGHGPNTSDAA